MSVQTTKDRAVEASAEAKTSSGEGIGDSHVPEWAENMEHTLKRLTEEKQAKRDLQPGLYL
ncbi:hypothetical protein [Ovoidimarina sediminis]|uniref:hypothetical protein n=1 Tax=Ovoidimarina sediminis TaxID=3079856 RepID=UPI002906BC73|nr:hypothetical protein [Rhodophyticola sp. MJ-SS7]MDU8945816.1 hypothetical protein [Rhodophyticola sp. MJ-SS7]